MAPLTLTDRIAQAKADLAAYRERARRGQLLHGQYEGILLERRLWNAEHDPLTPEDEVPS